MEFRLLWCGTFPALATDKGKSQQPYRLSLSRTRAMHSLHTPSPLPVPEDASPHAEHPLGEQGMLMRLAHRVP